VKIEIMDHPIDTAHHPAIIIAVAGAVLGVSAIVLQHLGKKQKSIQEQRNAPPHSPIPEVSELSPGKGVHQPMEMGQRPLPDLTPASKDSKGQTKRPS
jgi:hypothetical protein